MIVKSNHLRRYHRMDLSFDFMTSGLHHTCWVHDYRTSISILSIEVIMPGSKGSSDFGRTVSNQWITPSCQHQIITYEHQLKLVLLKYCNVWGEFSVG